MINTLIFDFGDVFINLDKEGSMNRALQVFELDAFDDAMITTNKSYEKGLISTSAFERFYIDKFPNLDRNFLHELWNGIILDFPEYRFNFLKELRQTDTYNLLLLSNTNTLHIDYVKRTVPFYDEFKSTFDGFYLSHHINMRKPDGEIFEWLLNKHDLYPEQCLFIDDTPENTHAAELLGINTWTIDPKAEDVIQLKKFIR